tara:strand:- start:2003 stop:3322 length:1320 start_codon:yes stop_codon:yes gene_type:complete
MSLAKFMNILDDSGGGGGAPEGKKDLRSLVSNVGRITSGFGKALGKKAGLLGINFGIASVLKQSQLFTGFIGSLFQIVGGFVDVVLAPFMPYAFKVLGYIAKVIPFVQAKLTAFTEWIGGIWEASDGIGDFIKNVMLEGAANIMAWGQSLWDMVGNKAFWSGLFEGMTGILLDIWNGVYDGLTQLFPQIKPYIDDLVVAVKNLWASVSEAFGPLLKAVSEAVKTIGPPLLKLTLWILNTWWNYWAKPILQHVVPFIAKTAIGFITHVIELITDIFKAGQEFWKGLNHLGRIFEASWNWLKTFFTGGFNDAIIQGVKSGMGAVSSLIANIWDWLGGIVARIKSTAMNVLNAVLDPIKALIRNIGGIVETIGNPGKAIGGLFSRAREGLSAIGGGGGGTLDITINGSSISPQEMAEGRASVRGNIASQGEFSANQLMFDGG